MENLKIYLINVGQGCSSLVLFPNGTTLLIDCCLNYEEETGYFPFLEDTIKDTFDEETETLSKRIDYLIITHPDQDHIKGIGKLLQHFDIIELCDNGYRYDNDTEDYEDYLEIVQNYEANGKYHILRANKELFKEGEFGEARVNILSPVRKDDEDINEDSVVVKIDYAGNSIMFPGDSGVVIWKDKILPIYKGLLETTVLLASHHGSRSFFIDTSIEDYTIEDFYTDHLKVIAPKFVFISVGKDNPHGLPDSDAVKVYRAHCPKDATARVVPSLVCNSWFSGTCEVTFSKNRYWEVHPIKIKSDSSNKDIKLQLKCRRKRQGGTVTYETSGADFTKKDYLDFEAQLCGDWGNREKISYEWMVQNNGILEDRYHKEIYAKSKLEESKYADNKWGRSVVYYGRHYMWCKASDEKGNASSDAFIVRVRRQPQKRNYLKGLRSYLKKRGR